MAVHLIPLATIVQLAHRQGCGVDVVMHLKVLWCAFVGKLAAGCGPTSCSETWTSLNLMFTMVADSRSWWMVSLFVAEGKLLLTPRLCALHHDGIPRRSTATKDGVAIQAAHKKNVATYPDLSGQMRRAHLVIMAVEVGGRWSEETRAFVSALAIARARSETPLMRRRAEQAWRMRWGGMLASAMAWAVASSLLDLPHSHGGDGITPAAHVALTRVRGDCLTWVI